MAVRLEDLVKGKGRLSDRQLKQVRKWVDDDWESHDFDGNIIKLVVRLLDTCEPTEEK